MTDIIASPIFGIFITIIAFEIGVWMNKASHSPIVNPLLVAIVLIISFLEIFKIPIESYENGGNIINMMLSPVTAVLAISIYEQRAVLKKFFAPILVGAVAGSATSIFSIYLMCKAFGLTPELTSALLPKSVTTPIAVELSSLAGGTPSVTVAAVVITGILGAVFSPTLIKLFRIKNPIARGVAIGTSSHALGTTRAIQLGETEGAMSGLSIGIAGFITVIILSLF